jgi:replicative superfamily II helicase
MKQLESYKEKCKKNPAYIPLTVGDEIDKAIEEWYSSRNLPIPPDEVGVGLKLDQENYERLQSQLGIVSEAVIPEVAETTVVPEVVPETAVMVPVAGEKPPFGTPEFWKWAHKRKLEKEAEAVQKEAEKAKKALEKEVEKAKKEAEKELEKAKKLAEKEAEKARKAAEKAAEKEAEKARKAAEKEAEKAAKKIVAKTKNKK